MYAAYILEIATADQPFLPCLCNYILYLFKHILQKVVKSEFNDKLQVFWRSNEVGCRQQEHGNEVIN